MEGLTKRRKGSSSFNITKSPEPDFKGKKSKKIVKTVLQGRLQSMSGGFKVKSTKGPEASPSYCGIESTNHSRCNLCFAQFCPSFDLLPINRG
jgi:hypothetical protein